MLTLILFLAVIGILVFVHEGGHFIAAKLSGIQVDEFALGFGPKVFSFKKGETEYKINMLPFGGYVKMAGEGEYDEKEKNPRGFEVQAAWKKLIVILAGVTMNVILAFIIYTGLLYHFNFAQYLPQVIPNTFPFGNVTHVVGFQPDPYDTHSPISKYHLNKTYIFTSINNKKITSLEDVASIINANKGKDVTISFTDTNGEHLQSLTVVPRTKVGKDQGAVGIVLTPVAKLSFEGWQRPFAGILYSIDMLQYNVSALATLIGQAVRTHTASVVTNNITGPVGIYEVTGAVYQQAGILGILNIIALLSLALALMNVLPLPVLDGGYAFIIILEAIARREISPKVKNLLNNIGIGFLILLMLFVTYNDIMNFNIIAQITRLFGH